MNTTTLEQHQTALATLINQSNNAVQSLQDRADNARKVCDKIQSDWSPETLTAVLQAQAELNSTVELLNSLPPQEYRQREISRRYIGDNIGEIEMLLQADLERRSKGRVAFRQSLAKQMGAIQEQIVVEDDRSACYLLQIEHDKIEKVMEDAEARLNTARHLASIIKIELSASALKNAIECTALVAFE